MLGLFGGGDGSIDSPYLVEDAQDLIAVASHTGVSISNYFKQTRDIDLSAYASNVGFYYDGFESIALYGSHYDGDNFKIGNLYQVSNNNQYSGLFNRLTNNGTITDLELVDAVVKNNYTFIDGQYYVGSIISNIDSINAYIYNCKANGVIECNRSSVRNVSTGQVYNNYIGGLCGYSKGAIDNCGFRGSLNGHGYISGVVGYTTYSSMENCKSKVSIEAYGYSDYDLEVIIDVFHGLVAYGAISGGIVGRGDTLVVNKCVSKCSIISDGGTCAGLAGVVKYINECAGYADIDSEGTNYSCTAGLAGLSFDGIDNSYAISNLITHVDSQCGGLVGNKQSGIYANNYTVCSINEVLTHTSNMGAITPGYTGKAFIFFNDELITDTLAQDLSGKTTSKLKDINTYTNYNIVYDLSDVPDNSFGNNGDIVRLPTISGQYYNGGFINIDKHTTYTKILGEWVKTSHIYFFMTSTGLFYATGLFIGVTLEDGDYYSYLDTSPTPDLYRVTQYIGGLHVDVASTTNEVSRLYIYDSSFRGQSYIDTPEITIGGSLYKLNTIANIQYDFIATWNIDTNLNEGYPYLRNVDYSGIFAIGFLRVQANGRIETIPLNINYGGNTALIVDTLNGLAEIELVDKEDIKASVVRMMTNLGIKSWSL